MSKLQLTLAILKPDISVQEKTVSVSDEYSLFCFVLFWFLNSKH